MRHNRRECDSLSQARGLARGLAACYDAGVGASAPAGSPARPDKGRDSNMPRKHKHEAPVTEAQALVVYEEPATPAIIEPTPQEEADDAEIEEQISLPNSVVKKAYKLKYRDRARNNGEKSKAAKRSAWDWLAQTLAGEVLTKDNKLKVEEFAALLAANGEPDALGRWPNKSKGWEGRLRMTGGLWLRRVVAEAGVLHLADGEELVPPADWIAKHLS